MGIAKQKRLDSFTIVSHIGMGKKARNAFKGESKTFRASGFRCVLPKAICLGLAGNLMSLRQVIKELFSSDADIAQSSAICVKGSNRNGV
eukprot:scaffold72380_cov45-Attheya_sp.AAC.1